MLINGCNKLFCCAKMNDLKTIILLPLPLLHMIAQYWVYVYSEHPTVRAQTKEEVYAWRSKVGLTLILGESVPKPVHRLAQAMFPEPSEVGPWEDDLTPQQSQCWPILMSRRDLIVWNEMPERSILYAPVIYHVLLDQDLTSTKGPKGPKVVVVTGYYEATASMGYKFLQMSKKNFRVVRLLGGTHMIQEPRELKKGTDLVIGTCWQLNRYCRRGILSLEHVTFLVIDNMEDWINASRKDMLVQLLTQFPTKRQTFIHTASYSASVVSLFHECTDQPVILKYAREISSSRSWLS